MDIYAQIAEKIISSQEAIIGPVAIEQAARVPHMKVDWGAHAITIDGNGRDAIDQLVAVYKTLFGQISVEVSKEAAHSLITSLTPEQLPQTLR